MNRVKKKALVILVSKPRYHAWKKTVSTKTHANVLYSKYRDLHVEETGDTWPDYIMHRQTKGTVRSVILNKEERFW